jgi:hypothetical protein
LTGWLSRTDLAVIAPLESLVPVMSTHEPDAMSAAEAVFVCVMVVVVV